MTSPPAFCAKSGPKSSGAQSVSELLPHRASFSARPKVVDFDKWLPGSFCYVGCNEPDASHARHTQKSNQLTCPCASKWPAIIEVEPVHQT